MTHVLEIGEILRVYAYRRIYDVFGKYTGRESRDSISTYFKVTSEKGGGGDHVHYTLELMEGPPDITDLVLPGLMMGGRDTYYLCAERGLDGVEIVRGVEAIVLLVKWGDK